MEVANRRRGVLSSASQSRPSLSGDRRAVSISWLLATAFLRQTRLQQRLRVRRVGGSKNRARRPGFDPLAQQAGRAKLRIDRQASVLPKVRHQRQEGASQASRRQQRESGICHRISL